MIKLGAHLSIAKSLDLSVDRAINLKCDYLQIFPCSPRSWKPFKYSEDVINKFKLKYKKSSLISVFIHGIYLINLGSNNQSLINNSIQSLTDSLYLQTQINAQGVIIHPGSSVNNKKTDSINNIVAISKKILSKNNKYKIIFESSAGAGDTIGSSFDDLQIINKLIDKSVQTGFCLDTCHMFASGIDITNLKAFENQINSTIGFDKVEVIHLNDSQGEFNNKKDRHDDIGKGEIGIDNLRKFVANKNINKIPLIVETPFLKNIDQDKPSEELIKIKKLLRTH